jgi:hypothetical protein
LLEHFQIRTHLSAGRTYEGGNTGGFVQVC